MPILRTRNVAVITGASGGIGRFMALGLAAAGCRVVLVCRDQARGQAVQDWIAAQVAGADTALYLADLRLVQATRHIGRDIAAAHPRIAVLVNNAGMFTAKRQVTAEGIEAVLALNHLAPFVLTTTLEQALRAGAPSRIVNIGSSMSDRARIDPANLQLTRGWGMVRAYARAKLAMLMATFAQAERLAGSGVVANVVHPGAVATGLIREPGAIGIAWRLMAPFMLTEQQGAAAPLHAALSAEWQDLTGRYVKGRVAVRPNHRALDAALVGRLVAETGTLVDHVLRPA